MAGPTPHMNAKHAVRHVAAAMSGNRNAQAVGKAASQSVNAGVGHSTRGRTHDAPPPTLLDQLDAAGGMLSETYSKASGLLFFGMLPVWLAKQGAKLFGSENNAAVNFTQEALDGMQKLNHWSYAGDAGRGVLHLTAADGKCLPVGRHGTEEIACLNSALEQQNAKFRFKENGWGSRGSEKWLDESKNMTAQEKAAHVEEVVGQTGELSVQRDKTRDYAIYAMQGALLIADGINMAKMATEDVTALKELYGAYHGVEPQKVALGDLVGGQAKEILSEGDVTRLGLKYAFRVTGRLGGMLAMRFVRGFLPIMAYESVNMFAQQWAQSHTFLDQYKDLRQRQQLGAPLEAEELDVFVKMVNPQLASHLNAPGAAYALVQYADAINGGEMTLADLFAKARHDHGHGVILDIKEGKESLARQQETLAMERQQLEAQKAALAVAREQQPGAENRFTREVFNHAAAAGTGQTTWQQRVRPEGAEPSLAIAPAPAEQPALAARIAAERGGFQQGWGDFVHAAPQEAVVRS